MDDMYQAVAVRTVFFLRQLVIVLALATAISACAGSSGDFNRAQSVIERLEAPDSETWLEREGVKLAGSLSAPEAALVARHAHSHSSESVRLYGVSLLFDKVGEQEGARAAADLAIKGDDLTALAWAWLHAIDPDLATKRLDLIRSEVQQRLPSLSGEQRVRAQALICQQAAGCR